MPILAQFRATFAGKVRFIVIRYPQWDEMIDEGGGFETLVDAALQQIRALSDGGRYLLAGYSFGGIVAYEVSRRLTELGERIGFLGLSMRGATDDRCVLVKAGLPR